MIVYVLLFLILTTKGDVDEEDSDESSEEQGIFSSAILESVEIPSYAEKGEDVTLVCRVKTGKWHNDVRSIKWFKNDKEFYRFEPEDDGRGVVKITRRKGVRVKAKMSWPDAIILKKVSHKSTGVYRCEVIFNNFDRQEKHHKMTVIDKLHKDKSKIPSYDYLCLGKGRRSKEKYWERKYWRNYCQKHLEDKEEKNWMKHMMEHLAKEKKAKWRGEENWKEVDKKWREEGKKVTFNTELSEEPDDEVKYLDDRLHDFLDSVWGGFCTEDDSCIAISYCNKDGEVGSCRIWWWFYIILALILVIHLFYCFSFILEYLSNGCKSPCCKYCCPCFSCCFPCFKCECIRSRKSTGKLKKDRKSKVPSAVKIIKNQPK